MCEGACPEDVAAVFDVKDCPDMESIALRVNVESGEVGVAEVVTLDVKGVEGVESVSGAAPTEVEMEEVVLLLCSFPADAIACPQ